MSPFQSLYISFFAIVLVSPSDAGQTCLSCNRVVQPKDCNKLTVCGPHEQCYIKRYVTSSGIVWFDVGCLDNSRCAATGGVFLKPGSFANTIPPSIIGKRDNVNVTLSKTWTQPPSVIGRRQIVDEDKVLCQHCCNGTICNSGGYCGAEPLENPGPVCYSCKEAPKEDGCDQITQCGEDEECFIGQTLNVLSQELRWTFGCKSNLTCVHVQEKRQIQDNVTSNASRVCDDCCKTNLCNNVCTNFVDWNAPVTPPHPIIRNESVATVAITTNIPPTTNIQMTSEKSQMVSMTTVQTIAPTTSKTTSTTSQTDPTTTQTTLTTVRTTTLDPIKTINCNFESGLCNWHQDPKDDGNWRIHSGETATANTGPTSDHTYGTDKGHYLYLEASDMSYEDLIRLVSGPVVWPKNSCLSFWYHMHGHFIASLNVYIKDSNGNAQKIWSQSQDQGMNWLHSKIRLPNTPGRIVIEGYRGADVHGDIAVDDIKLIPNCYS